ncbi:hypothetical protein CIB95_12440 [Lottiidibacillus patelloidae]|uniref:Uncharacterized protein n=1 Tax=Lottiidibacillus patelloidae TaxID=2670334 RepID=A0A263BS79_9BACI|nr:hypothetical protein CIB95_12440 [Lottiidibacillus patelloidae]
MQTMLIIGVNSDLFSTLTKNYYNAVANIFFVCYTKVNYFCSVFIDEKNLFQEVSSSKIFRQSNNKLWLRATTGGNTHESRYSKMV